MNIKTFITNNTIRICIPKNITLLDASNIIINKILEGFIIKRSTIDSTRVNRFPQNRTFTLSSINNDKYGDIEGDYTLEIEDEETLKLIKVLY